MKYTAYTNAMALCTNMVNQNSNVLYLKAEKSFITYDAFCIFVKLQHSLEDLEKAHFKKLNFLVKNLTCMQGLKTQAPLGPNEGIWLGGDSSQMERMLIGLVGWASES